MKILIYLFLIFCINSSINAYNLDSIRNVVGISEDTKRYSNIIYLLERVREPNELDKKFLMELLDHGLKSNNNYYAGRAYLFKGNYEISDNQLNEAYSSLLFAISYLKKTDSTKYLAFAYNNLGIILKEWGNYTGAISNYKNGINYSNPKDSISLSQAFFNMANVYDLIDKPDQVLALLDSSQKFLPHSFQTYGMALISYTRGLIFYKKELLDTAKFNFDKAHSLTKNNSLDQINLVSLSYLGLINAKKGKISKARKMCLEALDSAISLNSDIDIASTYEALAKVENLAKNYILAKDYLKKAESIYQNNKSLNSLINTYDLIIENYRKLGDSKNALIYNDLRIKLSDSVYKSDVLKGAINIENQIKLEKQFNQIKLLNDKNNIQELELSNKNIIIVGSIIIITLLAGLGIIVAVSYSKNQNYLKILKKHNIEIERLNSDITNNLKIVEQQKVQLESIVDELKNKEMELQANSIFKDKILAVIAHDLKNQVSFSRVNLQFLVEQYSGDKNTQDYEILNILYQSSNQVNNLLNNILSWSSSQINKISYNPVVVNFKSLVDETIAIIPEYSEIINYKFNNIDKDVFCDYNIISTILRNLITNAARSYSKNGTVEILLNQYENVEIIIKDNGKGMDNDLLDQLNSDDYNGINNNSMYSGIGILLCKDLIKLHKGNIIFESEIGIGTTVKVIFQNELV